MIHRLQRMLRMSPATLWQKVRRRIEARLSTPFARRRDARRATYSLSPTESLPTAILPPLAPQAFLPWADTAVPLAALYLEHRFDLLGSGWVQVKHGMTSQGLEDCGFPPEPTVAIDPKGSWLCDRVSEANWPHAARIWALIHHEYIPIDWHLDFKSGYRWSECTWYRDIAFGNLTGVDVKIPWELARFQHLPILAYAYAAACAGHNSTERPERYLNEFQDQVLDFLATNPPRFGVNWACTMDVAIRAANLVISFELFRALGGDFRPGFLPIFTRAILDHARHCIENLEYDPDFRNNHYLSDICGLLWASVWLPCNPESGSLLAFALQELVTETNSQFNRDGSNFEGSTSYHRLSAEMVLYSALLGLTLDMNKRASIQEAPSNKSPAPRLRPADSRGFLVEEPDLFPDWFWTRMRQALGFTEAATRPDGNIVQIGDNDNGRFLKLWPPMKPMPVRDAKQHYLNLRNFSGLPEDAIHWDETVTDHRSLVAAGRLILGTPDPGAPDTPEMVILRALLTKAAPSNRGNGRVESLSTVSIDASELDLDAMETHWGAPTEWRLPLPGIGLGLTALSYPDFGLYIFKSNRLFLSIRAGAIGQNGLGGHAHNDQLAVELVVDGQVIFQDAGTYVYTPLPMARNYFRSPKAHALPFRDLPPNAPGHPPISLFNFQTLPVARCTHFSATGFAGELARSARVVRIDQDAITILDFGPCQHPMPKGFHSPKYGALCFMGEGDALPTCPWHH